MNRSVALAVAVLVSSLSPGLARAEWHVWTTTRTERVLRAAPAGVDMTVRLAAARGEWESFQILMRCDVPVGGVNVVPGDLTGPGGAVLKAADARLFRQHQFEITVPTYRNETFQPGWYPDALIPFRHPVTGKPLSGAQGFTAVPFDLPKPTRRTGSGSTCTPRPDAKPGDVPGRLSGDGLRREPGRGSSRSRSPSGTSSCPRVSTLADGARARRPTGCGAITPRRSKAGKEAGTEPTGLPIDEAGAPRCSAATGSMQRRRRAAWPRSAAARRFVPRFPTEQIDAFRKFVDRYHVNAFCVPHPRTAVKDPVAERGRQAPRLAGRVGPGPPSEVGPARRAALHVPARRAQ